VNMQISELGENRVKVTLTGRLDTPGVGRVETGFVAALVPRGRSAIVDLSNVEFVASLGIRMFLSTARSLAMRQGRLVLFAPQEQVREVFDMVSLSDVLPIVADEASALAALQA
jgi:anti-sigma B factor antagonist